MLNANRSGVTMPATIFKSPFLWALCYECDFVCFFLNGVLNLQNFVLEGAHRFQN